MMHENSFKRALIGAGLFLIALGLLALFLEPLILPAGNYESNALSKGADSVFLSLFSGTMFGLGVGLAGNGVSLSWKSKKTRVFLLAVFSVFFLSLSAFPIFLHNIDPLLSLVCFFALLASSLTFLASSVFYILGHFLKTFNQ